MNCRVLIKVLLYAGFLLLATNFAFVTSALAKNDGNYRNNATTSRPTTFLDFNMSLIATTKNDRTSAKISIPPTISLISLIKPKDTPTTPLVSLNSKESKKFRTVWCYCNFPECVPKGYMCKSIQGICFTKSIQRVTKSYSKSVAEVYYDMSSNAFSRGCIESLSKREAGICLSQIYPSGEISNLGVLLTAEELSENDANLQRESDLQCCNQDVCNYEMSQPVFIVRKNDDWETPLSLSKQFAWFKTTTIVVSASGLVILVLLIFLAARMLRGNEKRITKHHRNTREYSKPAYYFERTLAENGSILCAKTLQREDLSSFCGLQPMNSNAKTNHHYPAPFAGQNTNNTKLYLSSPMSGVSCSTISSSHMSSSTRTCDFDLASHEEMEPLTRPHRHHSDHIDSVLIDGSFPT